MAVFLEIITNTIAVLLKIIITNLIIMIVKYIPNPLLSIQTDGNEARNSASAWCCRAPQPGVAGVGRSPL